MLTEDDRRGSEGRVLQDPHAARERTFTGDRRDGRRGRL